MRDQEVSGTALLIASALVMLQADPRFGHLVSDRSTELARWVLANCSHRYRFLVPFFRHRSFRTIARIIERLSIPGIVLHYALRKACIAQLARQSIAAGERRLVVLGAGFDGIAADLSRQFEHLDVWEVDHPATQRCKKPALDHIGVTSIHLVPADLSSVDLQHTLSAFGFPNNERTLWIAEGLLMYFEPNTVSRIFEQASSLSAPDSRFVFTFMRPDSSGRLRFQSQTSLVEWWLRSSGEPFHWGTPPELLPECIQPWRVRQIFGSDDLKKIGGIWDDQSLAQGELICLAEF